MGRVTRLLLARTRVKEPLLDLWQFEQCRIHCVVCLEDLVDVLRYFAASSFLKGALPPDGIVYREVSSGHHVVATCWGRTPAFPHSVPEVSTVLRPLCRQQ